MAEQIVGKSSGWDGPVEKYEKNKGTVGRKKITMIGASYLFLHKVLRDMLLVGGFEDVELCIHDINPKPLKVVADLLEKIARQKKTNIKVSRTLELDEALKGADAVILSISTGGPEAHYRTYEVCFKYGIPVGVGDTLGPAPMARNLRTVPVVVNIARRMEELCPDAVMLNFSNPMSVVTGAMARYSSIPCWGLCHSADELFSYFAKVFGCEKSQVRMDVGGVNHQAFVTKLLIAGADRTGDILQATLDSNVKLEDNLLETKQEEVSLQQAIYRILGVWPSTGHTHLAEFYEYFFTERRIDQLNLRSHLKNVIAGRKPLEPRQPTELFLEWTYGDEPVGDLHLLTTEHAHELLWAYFTKEPFTRVLNLLNTGAYLKGLPENACVEALVTVAGKKVTGKQIQLPPAVHSLVQRWTTIHDLNITAAMNCDRDAARQALFLDPHVRDMYDIEPMLEDFLEVTKQWLPDGWFK